ncbi:MAG TPA: C-GCAxxG-C-C family (seleno)protein [Paludibacter sp.]|nr:C-GCAxxG-C-C family (seleno)protein [Paludibacter sp.]
MEKDNEQNERQSSEKYFHALPHNLNCAQAILRGFQQEFNITDKEIETYRAWGGGRADGGLCGALFAAERLLAEVGKESVVEEFRNQTGSMLCSELKGEKYTCAELVRIADELVKQNMK